MIRSRMFYLGIYVAWVRKVENGLVAVSAMSALWNNNATTRKGPQEIEKMGHAEVSKNYHG